MKLLLLTLFVTMALLASSSANKFKGRSMVSRDEGHRQAQASVGRIIKLRAMNADTNQPIAALDPISGSVVIDLSTLATDNLNLEALTDGTVGSIKWEHDTVAGGVVRTENAARWAFCGNANNEFFTCSDLVEGFSTTVKATPYPEKFLRGTPGPSLSVSVTIKRSGPKMSLTLMDANKDTPVGVLVDGTVIDLSQTPAINIRADIPSGLSVRSVRFWLDGRVFRTENTAPYAFNGNKDQDFFPFVPAVGCYNVTSRAYTDRDARGSLRSTAIVNFCAIVKTSAPVPVPAFPVPVPVPAFPVPVAAAPGTVNPVVTLPFFLSAGPQVSSYGDTWVSDSPYVTGGTIRTLDASVEAPYLDALTRKGRFETSSTDKIQYKIPIANGRYNADLLFAEFDANAVGERVFKPVIEGRTKAEIDNFQLASRKYWQYSLSYFVTVSDGTLNIEFQAVTGFPMICGIYLVSVPPVPAPVPVPAFPVPVPAK